jgi:hypothetical protein
MCRRKCVLSILWRVLNDSLFHGYPGLYEGSKTLELFNLDFGLVCMGFLYDYSYNLRDSNFVEESAI